MKKLACLLLVAVSLILLFHMSALANETIHITLNGAIIDCASYGQEAVIIEGRTLVPFRAVFETVGADVKWDAETCAVTATMHENSVYMQIGSQTMLLNGKEKLLDVPPQIVNGRTLVPVRAAAESLDIDVEWDAATRTVILTKRQALDTGKCGPQLTWTLYDDGLLKISGEGRSYDYCKGLFGDTATREEIEAYQKELEGKTDLDSLAKYERGFQEGKLYDHENGQYIAPWYKYRQEIDFVNYTKKEIYDRENPNGWTYNRIEIDEGITYIGNWMFYRVCGPTELVVPEGVTQIGRWGIRYSPTLKKVKLPDSLETIENRGCSRLEVVEEIITGTGLKNIGDYAFAQNAKLETMVLNGNIETMGVYPFGYNTSLASVEFKSLTCLTRAPFVDCNMLKEVILPQNLITIEPSALVNRNLETVRIPENVAQIGAAAFYGCQKLESVYIDSPKIAAELANISSCGHLVAYAKKIYVKTTIDEVGKYLKDKCKISAYVNGYALYLPFE